MTAAPIDADQTAHIRTSLMCAALTARAAWRTGGSCGSRVFLEKASSTQFVEAGMPMLCGGRQGDK